MNCPLCLSSKQDFFYQGQNGEYFHCLDCDLIYLDTKFYLSKQDEKNRYDSHQNYLTDQNYINYLRSTFRHFENLLPRDARVLDFGCGPTEGMKHILSDDDVVCDSYDPFYFPHLELRSHSYDGIILSESLEHFYSPKNELDKILNLLKPNGMILIRTERHLGRDHFSSWYYHKDPTHVIFFSKSTFEFVAKRYNLFITFPDKNIVLLRRSLEA